MLDLLMSGCGSGESRWPHCPAATPAASSTARLDRAGVRARPGGGRAIPGYRSGPSRDGWRVTVAAATVRHDHGTPSPGRAPPSSANPLVVDTAIAAVPGRALAPRVRGRGPGVGPLDAVTVVLLLLESLPLIVRRRFPLAVLAVIAGATIVQLALLPGGPVAPRRAWASSSRSTPSASALERRTRSTATALRGAPVAVVFVGRAGIAAVALSLVQTRLIFVVAWLLGDATRIRRLYAATLEERAQLLEREREERAARAVREERERIARELHDVVTHHVSVIVIQAGGARRVLDGAPTRRARRSRRSPPPVAWR